MSRKRIALVCAAVVAGAGAVAIPVAANAGSSADLSVEGCSTVSGDALMHRTEANLTVRNSGSTDAKTWKLEFEVPVGRTTVVDPGTFDLRKEGGRFTVTPKEGRGTVPANGARDVAIGIDEAHGGILQISGCTVTGGDSAPSDSPRPTDDGSFVIDHTTVHLMWRAPQKPGSQVAKYEVFEGEQLVKTMDNGMMTMTNIDGLLPATAYTYRVRAVYADGKRSPFSKDITLTTRASPGDDAEKPVMPAQLNGEAVGANQVSLRWQAATDDVAVTGYRIYRDGNRVAEPAAHATSATVGGLEPSTAYRFKVTAVDASGKESDPTEEVSVTTGSGGGNGGGGGGGGGTAGAPADFTAGTGTKADGSLTQHYLNLGWTVPKGNGQITTYQVYLNGKLAQTFMWGDGAAVLPVPSGTATREVLVGANPGKTYAVKIRARLGDGTWGAFSAEKTVTTAGR
ncbi:fibronectin type III domain-containing protein [Streptomyces sp. IBSNAI002]|uniref:fibronectin type III domain-containing protein n=1 Tax=Streptomyces sp. IBSNAI002 TaxID=3457500 RepID=UPI003FD1832A